ncbi:class I SAM-dependent methyltransferase [Tianweitania sediminis]|uniref:Class I SAM-dependent methyltransferase n=1 Tax=Tianweitania sediminis TaxID=1502156 RepID=A0A8J7UKE1_9HYPH|nr:class I SAM-dependent methyltransferase [Tianweitania sediminis]MBP0439785.1 class I SAM-dependent methyltransferase [Tianweitania sediminis]
MAIAKQALNSVHAAAVFNRRIRVLAGHLANHLEDGRVLDVGCGDGTLARAVMEMKPDLTFSGIDVFLRPSVAIPAEVYDGVTIPYADDAFDWVTIVDVLHHTDTPAAVLKECARVARRGVVIKDHFRDGLLADKTLRFMDWVGNRGHDVRLPYNYLSRREWHAIFDAIGVESTRLDPQLNIYPAPFGAMFDRQLHFVATVRKNARFAARQSRKAA